MKSIFKKIALVLALAMVVTMIPAQTAKAAEGDVVTSWGARYFYAGETNGSWSTQGYAGVKVNGKSPASQGYTVSYESLNTAVATVDAETGLIKAVAKGETKIVATLTDAEGAVTKEDVAVTVRKSATQVAFAASNDFTDISVGSTFTVAADMYVGDDKVDATVVSDVVRFTSGDPSIIKIDAKTGAAQAVGVGTTKINIFAGAWDGAEHVDPADKKSPVKAVRKTTEVVSVEVTVKPFTDQCRLEAVDTELIADGEKGTMVTFKLYKSAGELDLTAKDVQVKFDATRGTFAESKVALENGQATVLYKSEINTVEEVAKLTAIVVSAGKDDQDLINKSASCEILLKPSTGKEPSAMDTGATVTQAIVVTADRVTLYFDKEIAYTAFLDGNGVPTNFKLAIADNVDEADTATTTTAGQSNTVDLTEANVLNVVKGPVAKSLTFVLKHDVQFTDNSKFILNFEDRRVAGAPVTTTGVKNYVTDAKQPSLLNVEAIDQRSIKLTFSEPMDFDGTDFGTAAAGKYPVIANNIRLSAYPINPVTVDQATAATSANLAWVENITGSTTAGLATLKWASADIAKDGRNQIILTLGRNGDTGKQIYFGNTTWSVQMNMVGDYASRTHSDNWINTQTSDFKAPTNDLVPDFEVEVQSPEQILVKFNSIVESTSAKVNETVERNVAGVITADTTSNDKIMAPGMNINFLVNTDKWATDGNTHNVEGWSVGGGTAQKYRIVDITPAGGTKSMFLIEVLTDWTKVCDVIGTKNNYYNFDFAISVAADAVYNVANGKQNAAKTIKLGGALKQVDDVSPVIDGDLDYKYVEAAGVNAHQVTVKFSEPVQIQSLIKPAATPSDIQGAAIPAVTVQIVADDLTETYNGTLLSISEDDYTLTVASNGALAAGKKYWLYIREISDDIGNTSHTLKKDFTIGAAKNDAGEFQILSVVAKYDVADGFCATTNGATSYFRDGALDAIFVEFTADYAKAGGTANATSTTNWTINGAALPAGTSIVNGLLGANGAHKHAYGITIILPDGTITATDSTIVAAATTIKSATGADLTGPKRVKTQYYPCDAEWHTGHTHP